MFTSTELARIDGATVLVRSRRDERNPPTGVRGTIVVRPQRDPADETPPHVQIVLSYPTMFIKGAHEKVFVLDEAQVDDLLRSEHNGAFEWTTDESLDP